jgi:hypothetical protein
MQALDIPRLTERLNEIADAYPHGKKPTEGGVRVWFDTLREFTLDDVFFVLVDLPKRGKRGQPGPNDVYEACAQRRTEQLERRARAQNAEPGFDASRLRGNPDVALAAIAKTKSMTRRSPDNGGAWIGAIFERLANDDPALSDYAIKLAEDAERIFAAKGRDVLAEYAATQRDSEA